MHNKSSVIVAVSLARAESHLSSDEFHFDASQSSNLFQVLYQTDILILLFCVCSGNISDEWNFMIHYFYSCIKHIKSVQCTALHRLLWCLALSNNFLKSNMSY